MLEFIAGIAVGAAFSPYWMMLWARIVEFVKTPKA